MKKINILIWAGILPAFLVITAGFYSSLVNAQGPGAGIICEGDQGTACDPPNEADVVISVIGRERPAKDGSTKLVKLPGVRVKLRVQDRDQAHGCEFIGRNKKRDITRTIDLKKTKGSSEVKFEKCTPGDYKIKLLNVPKRFNNTYNQGPNGKLVTIYTQGHTSQIDPPVKISILLDAKPAKKQK